MKKEKNKNFNILILSVGTRNKIVEYFKKELNGNGKVIVTDASDLAPAIYEADKHYIVPKIHEESYLDIILDICEKENVAAVLSLIDPELSLLAKNKDKFLKLGTTPIVSDYEVVELCFDKYKMFTYLKKNGFNTVNSYLGLKEFYDDQKKGIIDFPVFTKPVRGSASININKVNNKNDLEVLFKEYDNLMIQEFMDGFEYGADVYIDMISKEVVSIYAKEKILMRAGETDKSRSIKDEKLFNLVKNFVEQLGLVGIVDVDLFKKGNEYYISEVNPRFGGGYPHGHECGVNIPKMIIENIKDNKVNKSIMSKYKEDTFMMKYNEVLINE